MEYIGIFIRAIAQVLSVVLTVYMWIIIIRALLSWVNPDPYNPIVRFLHNVTEPALSQIRRRLPINFGAIDLSPLILLLAIMLLSSWLVPSLDRIGLSLMR
jgi:YggT family protein